jgi:putative hydrolase of the HAD superfamily
MIRQLLFDLDNTLYSARYGLEENAAERMYRFVSDFLGLPIEETKILYRQESAPYGSTLEWLMAVHGLTADDTERYYAAVHPEDEADALSPNPALREFLAGIPIPKAIMTNSSRTHAQRVIQKQRLEGIFTHIFDLEWNNFQGKPLRLAFQRVLDALGATADTTLFVDDCPEYIAGYLALGGPAVLMDEFNTHQDYLGERIQDITEIVRYFSPVSRRA